MEASGQQSVFRRTEEFEIDNAKYIEVTVDGTRMTCRGAKWRVFEALLSFIGAALKEKRRRFSAVLFVAGGVLFELGFLGFALEATFEYASPVTLLLFGICPMFAGVGLILVYLVAKPESFIIYTPAKEFRIEGSAGFIDELWSKLKLSQ